MISLTAELDYESFENLTFNVTATDGGSPSNSDTANVLVIVADANDNSPIFSSASYSADVSEGNYSEEGQLLLTTVSLSCKVA